MTPNEPRLEHNPHVLIIGLVAVIAVLGLALVLRSCTVAVVGEAGRINA
jgi:hypothetical protein